MKKKKQIKPKWFEGVVYQKGTTVLNPLSGESYKLNALELSIYDFIMGSNLVLEDAHNKKVKTNKKLEKIYDDLYKGLHWFQENNIKAYMVLLD